MEIDKAQDSHLKINWELNSGTLTPTTITEINLQDYFQWSCFKHFPGVSINKKKTEIR